MNSDWHLPDRLQSWYRVCGSRELPPGRVIRWDLPGRSFAVYRGRGDGQVHALAAHCAHMGTHLAHGEVVGDELRCPLHHWDWGGDGACRRIPGSTETPRSLRQRVYPVAERYGSVFLFNGPVPRYPAPEWSTAAAGEIRTLAGPTVRLRCPWPAVAANGFDIQHLRTVHGRVPRTEPVLERLDSYRLRMRYVSRVTGRALEDRAVQWLSGDHIRITVTCFGGTVIMVESDLGRTRSAADEVPSFSRTSFSRSSTAGVDLVILYKLATLRVDGSSRGELVVSCSTRETRGPKKVFSGAVFSG